MYSPHSQESLLVSFLGENFALTKDRLVNNQQYHFQSRDGTES